MAASWALHEERVVGGPSCAPDVVRYRCLQGHRFLDASFREEPVMDPFGRLHKGAFPAPESSVGLVVSNMGPLALGQTAFDPLQVLLSLQRAPHIHHHIPRRRVVFNLAPKPYGRCHWTNQEL